MTKKLILLTLLIFCASVTSAQSISTTTCPGQGCADVVVSGNGSLGIQVTGTWVGTITFRGTVGTSSSATYTDLLVYPSDVATSSTTTTTNGIFTVGVAGYGRIRAVFTSYTSGVATIAYRVISPARSNFAAEITADVTVSDVTVTSSALPTGAATAANQATQASAANQTTEIIALQLIDNPVGSSTGGTAGTGSFLSGCVYNSTPPTIINGQQISLQCDENGALNIAAILELTGAIDIASSALPTGASTSANQSTEITALQLIDNPIGSVTGGTAGTASNLSGGIYNSSAPTLTNGQQAGLQLTSAGALITSSTFSPAATSGCYLVSAATNNSTNCKASAGSLYGFRLINTTDTIYYLRLYNLASAPTCSSATGFIESIPVPSSVDGNGVVWTTQNPIAYSTGIGFCFTSGSASTNNGSAATGVFGAIQFN